MGGYRWMYYATGVPGWMRLGFSPGWWGTTPNGLPPGATFLLTGSWPTPQANAAWQALQSGQMPFAPTGWFGVPWMPFASGAPGWTKEQQLQTLKNQAEWVKNQLDAINKQIESLENEGKE